MNSITSEPKQISLKLIVFPVLFWLSAVCYGWSIEPFCGEFIAHKELVFSIGQKFLFTQSSIIAFLFFGASFQFLVIFLSIPNWKKAFLLLIGHGGSLILFLVAIGSVDNWLLAKLCLTSSSKISFWIPDVVKSQGWTILAIFFVSNFVATVLLHGAFWRLRIAASETQPAFRKTSPSIRILSFVRLVTVVGFILYGAISFQMELKEKNYLHISAMTGFSTALLFALITALLRVLSNSLNKGILFVVWCLMIFLIWNTFQPSSVPSILHQTLFGPTILTLAFSFLILGSAIYLFETQFIDVVVEAVKSKSNRRQESTPADPFADPDEVQITQKRKTEEATALRSLQQEQKPVVEFSRAFLAFLCALFFLIGLGSHFIFRVTNPYIMASTWNWNLAKLVAESRAANNYDHFYETHTFGDSYTPKRYLTPLIRIGKNSTCAGIHSKFDIHFESQPLIDRNPEILAVIGSLRNSFPKQLSFEYTTRNPNGKIYLELIATIQERPVLDGKDLTKAEQRALLRSKSFVQPKQFRNMHFSPGMFQKPFWWNCGFENCTFDPTFRFSKEMKFGHQVRLYEDCLLTENQWIDLLLDAPLGQLVAAVKNSETSLPDIAIRIFNIKKNHDFTGRNQYYVKDEGFWADRKPVDRRNFSVVKNLNAITGYKQILNLQPKQKSKTFPFDINTSRLTVESGIITGVGYDGGHLRSDPDHIQFDQLKWLRIPMIFLDRRNDTYANFQKPLPQLEALSLLLNSYELLWSKRAFTFKNKPILQSPKLKAIQLNNIGFHNNDILRQCNVETVIVNGFHDSFKQWKLQDFLKLTANNNRIKNLVIANNRFQPYCLYLSDYLNRFGLKKYCWAYLFDRNYVVKAKSMNVYFVNQSISENDFRLPWKKFKERYRLIRFPKK